MNTTKQTSGNNPLLRAVKAMMNRKIYKTFSEVYNRQKTTQIAEREALYYLSQYFSNDTWPKIKAELMEAR